MKNTIRYIGFSIIILVILVMGDAAAAHNQIHKQIEGRRFDRRTYTGFLLVAQAEKAVIGPNEPVNLRLTIKNVSKRVRFIRETSAIEQYRLVVLDERGKPAPVTEYGEKELKPKEDHLGRMMKAIEPGEESRNTIEVNKLYDMSSPGTYSVTAWRISYDKDGMEAGSVQSNKVSVRVAK